MNSTGNIVKRLLSLFLSFFIVSGLFAQEDGYLKGKVVDDATKEPVVGAVIYITGTYAGAYSDENGEYKTTGVKPGDYTVEVKVPGDMKYSQTQVNGVAIASGENTLDISMKSITTGIITIYGDPELIDVNDGQSKVKLTSKDIGDMNAANVEELASMQVGVNKTPDGLSVRGGRVYETKYMIEGISAKDPLAGTGFGVQVSSGAIEELDITTGGGDAEFGDGTSGVINTKLKEGGERLHIGGTWMRDNLGFNVNQGWSWNTDQVGLNASGPIPFLGKDSLGKSKASFFTAIDSRLTDTYFGEQANQLHSSLFTGNDSMWAPRQDNHYSNTIKLTYKIKTGMKISLVNQHSLNINQNTRALQVIGNNVIMTPGFQYPYSLNLDNATTYTHHSNLTIANFTTLLTEKWTLNASLGRLFTNLRADANGRPFREATVDAIYDPGSIVTDPVTLFNPGDSAVYVFPGPGLYNNGGISTLWHDHYAQEYTLRYKFTKSTENDVHFFTFGHEHKEQEYQWIDVTRPWVGAPIVIDDTTTTQSTSVGSTSDVWSVNPAVGGFFFQDEIRYKGIIAFVGGRFEYWAPGKFADEAVENPDAPVTDGVREEYKKRTTAFLGKRWKARILPKLRVSFPVTENNVLYFNYGHSTLMPHPRFLYAGLNPVYQDRSFLSNLGNPSINPEVTVSYEVGLKTKLSKDQALSITAFYNDKFDYIVSRRILIQDQTGRFVEKTFFINQDYARIRGVEVSYTHRINKWFKGVVTGGYQIATGKSNSAAESALQIKQNGFVPTTSEQFLAWDRPFDFKLALFFRGDTTVKPFGLSLNNWRAFVSSTFKSGLRYTPYELTGTADNGRPVYERIDDEPFSKLAAPWFWTDVKISRDFFFNKGNSKASLSFEVRNVFNNKNAQIINGVTGRAYENGDPLPITARDPNYPDPQDNGLPPNNPARYLSPRQMMVGLQFQF